MSDSTTFETAGALEVPDRRLVPVPLRPGDGSLAGVVVSNDHVRFSAYGWFEVLLTVTWDTTDSTGHRFAHTAIPDDHPLHSEAIEASVLNALSGGKQLLRGNTIFGPDEVDSISLAVWQDSGRTISVHHASLGIRPLSR